MSTILLLGGLLVVMAATQYLAHHLERKQDAERDALRRASDDHYLDRLAAIGRPSTLTIKTSRASTEQLSREMQAAIDRARRSLGGTR